MGEGGNYGSHFEQISSIAFLLPLQGVKEKTVC
jgi:hypothetical protein